MRSYSWDIGANSSTLFLLTLKCDARMRRLQTAAGRRLQHRSPFRSETPARPTYAVPPERLPLLIFNRYVCRHSPEIGIARHRKSATSESGPTMSNCATHFIRRETSANPADSDATEQQQQNVLALMMQVGVMPRAQASAVCESSSARRPVSRSDGRGGHPRI